MTISYGEDYQYARSRLTGSYVKHDNQFKCVQEIERDGLCYLRTWDGHDFVAYLDSLDLSTIKLGYYNYGREAIFTFRIPTRFYKQGLKNNNTKMSIRNRMTRFALPTEANKLITNIYPSLETCLDIVVNGEANMRAFCRSFAISKFKKEGYKLLYKEKVVGSFNEDSGDVILEPKFMFLQEAFEECK